MSIGFTRRSVVVGRKKNARSYRLSDDTIRRLADLALWLDSNDTAIIERAVLELHRREARNKPPEKSGK